MQQSIPEDKPAVNSSLNDGYQTLQAAQSPGSLSETDWTVCDDEPQIPDNADTDMGRDASEETPPGDLQQRERLPEAVLTPRGRLVLQDYEIQLRLLEAQNKRRLEMARQEQDKLAAPSLQMQTQMKGPPEPSSATVMNAMQPNPTMAATNMMGTMPPNQPNPMVTMLQARVKILQNENQSLRRQLRDAKNASHAIFHCITGDEGEKVYLDQPRWVRCGDKLALEASNPVLYPEAYGLYKSLHFVVCKTYSANMRAATGNLLPQGPGGATSNPEPDSETIKLVSEDMMGAMEKLVARDEANQKKLPCLVTDNELRAPHLWWYCHRNPGDMLEGLTPSQAEAMQSLRRWLDEVFSKAHAQVDDQFRRGMVSASSMGYLIQPGDVLACRVEDGLEARLATSWLQAVAARPGTQGLDEETPSAYDERSTRKWHVDAWSYRYTGDFYRMRTRLNIQLDAEPAHEDEISITSLDAFPLRFASQEVRDTLERRGKTFWNCRNGKYVSYSTKDRSSDPEQRYMIDCRTYHNTHPGSGSVGTVGHSEDVLCSSKVRPAFANQEDVPSEPDVYLFPRTVTGYDLRRKRWEDVDLDHIREISWNKSAFSHLLAECETKELTQAVITSHISSQREAGAAQSRDKGLVMLLHGAPGTGKTFTIERVAELFETPLYAVRCRELGNQPEDVAKRLEDTFHLAKTWGCILLLAEAEVFLERQASDHVAQHARISALVRALQGYGGVLILESNRLRTLDGAFRPHIQLALHFKPLTEQQRTQAWRNLLNHLRLLDDGGYVDGLAKREMSGHQMQDVITRARQLAQFQGKKMTPGHVLSVAELVGFP